MKRVLNPTLPKSGAPVELDSDEATHAIRVLRLGDGDTVEALDGNGRAVSALLRVQGKKVFLEAVAGTERADSTQLDLTLELAILKGDAMEWAIEKAVELGVSQIFPLMTQHTVVQVSKKGPEEFQARWQKIADQALKQCGRLTRLTIHAPVSLNEHLVTARSSKEHPRLWCDETSRESAPELLHLMNERHLKHVIVSVGPEGGWSEAELKLLSTSGERVSLGPLVLRGETAAVSAISIAGASLRLTNKLH